MKNYATTTTCNTTCMFRRDYSYAHNSKCLSCKFCYKLTADDPKPKVRAASMLKFEEKTVGHLYKVPITVSRWSDPGATETSYSNNWDAIGHILWKKGQVIYKSATECFPTIAIFEDNYKNTMYHARVCSADTSTGNTVRKLIAPGFASTQRMLEIAQLRKNQEVDTAILFDPFIIGLNNADLEIVAQQASDKGVYKVIIRQLMATDYFKNFIHTHVGRRFSEMLSVKIGPYWTYDNEVLLDYILQTLESTKDSGVTYSMCDNKYINSLLNNHSNCCQFDNANAMYDISVNGKGRYGAKIIDLKKDNNDT